MRSIILRKNYSDEIINNIFVPVKSKSGVSLKLDIDGYISSATKTVCLVLESGMHDSLAKTLSNIKARVYALVPKIDENKYIKLKGKAIIREVPRIRGNYCIIDNKVLLFFDNSLEGVVITSEPVISTVKKIFEKEFWENSTEEFIEKKAPCAEITFDVPPIYGDEANVIIDDGFEAETPLKKLFNEAKTVAYNKKIAANAKHNIIISNISANSAYLKTATNESICFFPKLPFCFIEARGSAYAVNFDIADYNNLPEKGSGRLFAVKIDNYDLGDYYKFYKHKTIGDLAGQTVIDADGESVKINKYSEEKRKIEVDLRIARELQKIESDPEALEARLEKRNKELLCCPYISQEILFNIELKMQSKTITRLADVYEQFDEANKSYASKINELSDFIKKLDNEEFKKSLDKLKNCKFDKASEYQEASNLLNKLIDEINNDDSLGELLGGKKSRKSVSKMKIINISMDMPRFGKLYQQKSKYEYVLKNERDLDEAMNEMEKAGIEPTSVIYLEDK